MLEKFLIPVLVFFNSVGNSIDPTLIDDKKSIDKIQNEILLLERRKQMVEVTIDDFASREVRIEKISKSIASLRNNMIKIEKVNNLKVQWAKEDSLKKKESVKTL